MLCYYFLEDTDHNIGKDTDNKVPCNTEDTDHTFVLLLQLQKIVNYKHICDATIIEYRETHSYFLP